MIEGALFLPAALFFLAAAFFVPKALFFQVQFWLAVPKGHVRPQQLKNLT